MRVLGLLCSLPDRISAVYRDAASEIPHALREQYSRPSLELEPTARLLTKPATHRQFTRLVTTQALNALQLKVRRVATNFCFTTSLCVPMKPT